MYTTEPLHWDTGNPASHAVIEATLWLRLRSHDDAVTATLSKTTADDGGPMIHLNSADRERLALALVDYHEGRFSPAEVQGSIREV